MTKTLKTLSRDTKRLLLGSESEAVDFKQTAKSITADDLVAFANSEAGGTILIGVEETNDTGGQEFGKIIGHEIGDAQILLLLGKAQSCHPPVRIDIQFENTNRKAIIRLDIPTGESRPHCTEKGTYVVRKGSRNAGLRPQQLLSIFMEAEAAAFAKRFSQATDEMKFQMIGLARTVENLEGIVEDKINEIASTLSSAEDGVDTATIELEELSQSSDESALRLRSILDHLNVEDPIRARQFKQFVGRIARAFEKNPLLIDEAENLADRIKNDDIPNLLTRADLSEAVSEAVRNFNDQNQSTNGT